MEICIDIDKSYSANLIEPVALITARGAPQSRGRSQLGSLRLAAMRPFVSCSKRSWTRSREGQIGRVSIPTLARSTK